MKLNNFGKKSFGIMNFVPHTKLITYLIKMSGAKEKYCIFYQNNPF